MKNEYSECQIKQWSDDCRKIIIEELMNYTKKVKSQINEIENSIEIKDPLELLEISKNQTKLLNINDLTNTSYFKMFDNEMMKFSLILSIDEIYSFLIFFENNKKALDFLYNYTKNLVFISNSMEEKKNFFNFIDSFILVCLNNKTNENIILIFGNINIGIFEKKKFIKLKMLNCHYYIFNFTGKPTNYKEFFENFLENQNFTYSTIESNNINYAEIYEYEIFTYKDINYIYSPSEMLSNEDHKLIFINSFMAKTFRFFNFQQYKYIRKFEFEETNYEIVYKKFKENKNFLIIVRL